MKVRTKLISLGALTLASLIVSIVVLYTTYKEMLRYKDSEIAANEILYDFEYLLTSLENSLYTDLHITEVSRNIQEYHSSIKDRIEAMQQEMKTLDENINKVYRDLYYNEWKAYNTIKFSRVVERLSQISRDEMGRHIAMKGLISAAEELENREMEGKKALLQAIKIIEDINTTKAPLLDHFNELTDVLEYEIRYRQVINIIAIIILTMILLTGTVITTTGISRGIENKINSVDSAVQRISTGDLTTKLELQTRDEFSELAENFNKLISILSYKTGSMQDVMNEISATITESVNFPALIQKITDLSMKICEADAAAILLVDQYEDLLKVEYINGFYPVPYNIPVSVKAKKELILEKFRSTPIEFGKSYLSASDLLKGEPFFMKNTLEHKEKMPFNSKKDDILFISSCIAIPLVVSNKLLGIISLIKRKPGETFSDLDFSNIKSFLEYASLTIDNMYKYIELLEKHELKREIGVASDIQTQLLPKKIPVIENVDCSAFTNSARGISGDYYDIYKIPGNKVVATVCDVAGKGVASALVLVIIRTIMHLASSSRLTARDLLSFLNRSITGKVKIDYFASVSVLIYDEITGELTYSSAGDTPLIHYSGSTGKIESIVELGLPIGIDPDAKYNNTTLSLDEDDILFMFTDGILEARNIQGENYSLNKLKEAISAYGGKRTETISLEFQEHLKEFKAHQEQTDDETMLIFKKI